MNIFVLDTQPTLAARYHTDRHVVKMVLETAQMLCTAGNVGPYKPTHASHPCTVWASYSLENWCWLRLLGEALGAEYTHRYGKVHKSHSVISSLPRPQLPRRGQSPFALAMPECYKQDDAVEAYRAYYRGEKAGLFRWTGRTPPSWL